jgi:hypothetical protein
MEPVTAIALFCNVLDLADRGIGAVRAFKELYGSTTGQTDQHETINKLVGSMNVVVAELGKQLSRASAFETEYREELHRIAAECNSITSEINAILKKCKARRIGSFWSSSRATVRSLMKKTVIESHLATLEKHRRDLNSIVKLSTQYVDHVRTLPWSWLLTLPSNHVTTILGELSRLETQQAASTTALRRLNDQLSLPMAPKDSAAIVNCLRLMGETSTVALEAINRNIILDGLSLGQRSANPRFDDVRDAAVDTFNWILDDPDALLEKEPRLELSFVEWLRMGNDVFHIAGKPGSGKSTLMKFLVRHEKTKVYLGEWAAGKKLCFASFFFWKPGTECQNSLPGLLRGLLHSILAGVPELIPILFPSQWDPTHVLAKAFRRRDISNDEVSTAFEHLIQNSAVLNDHRFCFFIDGLDEFDEQNCDLSHHGLARKLRQWASSSSGSIKICLSSRELQAFEIFPISQKIRLHNLTFQDVRNLVSRSLSENEAFQKLRSANPDECTEFISQISNDASGVFLSVILLLASINKALDNGDSIVKLQTILQKIPKDLDAFLASILDDIEDVYREEAYFLLGLVMSLEGYLLSNGIGKIHLLKGSLLCSHAWVIPQGAMFLLEAVDIANSRPSKQLEAVDTVALKLKRGPDGMMAAFSQIRRRCNGLLDICENDKERGYAKVVFMHRSVPEALQKHIPKMCQKYEINGITNERLFEVLSWLLAVSITKSEEDIIGLADGLLGYRRAFTAISCLLSVLTLSGKASQQPNMDSLEVLETHLLRDVLRDYEAYGNDAPDPDDDYWGALTALADISRGKMDHFSVLGWACYVGAWRYVEWKLEKCPMRRQDAIRTQIISHMMQQAVVGICRGSPCSAETLHYLFSLEASPDTYLNHPHNVLIPAWNANKFTVTPRSRSAWYNLLFTAIGPWIWLDPPTVGFEQLWLCVEEFLLAGAPARLRLSGEIRFDEDLNGLILILTFGCAGSEESFTQRHWTYEGRKTSWDRLFPRPGRKRSLRELVYLVRPANTRRLVELIDRNVAIEAAVAKEFSLSSPSSPTSPNSRMEGSSTGYSGGSVRSGPAMRGSTRAGSVAGSQSGSSPRSRSGYIDQEKDPFRTMLWVMAAAFCVCSLLLESYWQAFYPGPGVGGFAFWGRGLA